jgi:hypothetical protein
MFGNGCRGVATGVDVESDTPTVHGQVFDHLLAATKANEVRRLAVRAGRWRFQRFNIDVVVVLVLLNAQYLVAGQVEDVGGHRYASPYS